MLFIKKGGILPSEEVATLPHMAAFLAFSCTEKGSAADFNPVCHVLDYETFLTMGLKY